MMHPTHILLIKSHSMGIGDLLRSSAAWRALKNRWPQAHLHLLMLSKHAGYASETFIKAHHLLSSATFITVKTGAPGQQQTNLPFASILQAAKEQLTDTPIDLVIDCEPYGIKTSLLARKIAKNKRAVSVGIAQFPMRKYFYDLSAPSVPQYANTHKLVEPMDYTERDFVALAALDIARNGIAIELEVSAEGKAWKQSHAARFDDAMFQVVLNIGCGTADAVGRRPALGALAECMATLYLSKPYQLHLSGADFEAAVNHEFMALLEQHLLKLGKPISMTNWAGQCKLAELTGLISQAHLFVSSDSGPYHMGVGLGVPTLCWFNYDEPAAYHRHSHVATLVMPTPAVFTQAALRLQGRSSD